MASKRRRAASNASDSAPKKKRFTIDHASLPTITEAGVVLVTGAGDVGQLGLGSDVLERSRFCAVTLEQEIVDVCAGGMHTVCLTKDGQVLTFGCNDEGALGRVTSDIEDSEFTPSKVDLPDQVIQISAGDSHTAALLKDGRVFAWGTFRDMHGNMGLTPKGNEKLPFEIITEHVIIKIASGDDHIAFLTTFGEVYTCGRAEQGQLGRITERSSDRNARSTAGVDQLGKLLYPSLIALKPSLRLHFDDIWAGSTATFAKVAQKDNIYVFGLNNYNQLGLAKTASVYLPSHSIEFSKRQWKSIVSAPHHTIAVDNQGVTNSIGRKEYGRLGLGKECDDATNLSEIPLLMNKKVVSIGCSSSCSFAVTESGELYSWGMSGQLGLGDEDDRWEPTLVKSKALLDKKVLKVSSGGQHTVILATVSKSNNNEVELNSTASASA